ncbi:MAG TPA: lipoyl(octanoyl) transferase LipB [Polyangia bacterium]|nr:lipoyl(octanoyl) transferase LipB [Polyangia bacterium]
MWCWLGRVPFAPAAALQERLRADLLSGTGPETLLLLEHAPVITLGRSAQAGNILASQAELARHGIDVVRATRGGDVTYHGPGQLVGYPIVRLRGGVVAHMTGMARAIAAVLKEYGIDARWRREAAGLWVGDAKICAFGVHVRGRATMHGFALNVAADVSPFQLIVPCGIAGARTTAMAALGVTPPPLQELAAAIAERLGPEVGVTFTRDDARPNCNVGADH